MRAEKSTASCRRLSPSDRASDTGTTAGSLVAEAGILLHWQRVEVPAVRPGGPADQGENDGHDRREDQVGGDFLEHPEMYIPPPGAPNSHRPVKDL